MTRRASLAWLNARFVVVVLGTPPLVAVVGIRPRGGYGVTPSYLWGLVLGESASDVVVAGMATQKLLVDGLYPQQICREKRIVPVKSRSRARH
jgi:hypothetical protein